MKNTFFALLLLVSMIAFAADQKGAHAMDPKQAEMMKAFQQYATPGEAHKRLTDMAGKWTYTSKFWESPSSQPQESKGTSSMKLILGGRFLQQEVKGMAMGMPFEGVGTLGYDNVKEKYVSTWIDTMGTGMMTGEGTMDKATQTLKESGEYSCPISDKKSRPYRTEWKIIDKNNSVFALFGPDMVDNKEFKMMEMTYKRSK